MALLVNNFSTISSIAATTRRLRELLEEMDHVNKYLGVEVEEDLKVEDCLSRKMAVGVSDLRLKTPSGQLICEGLSFQLEVGRSLLIEGLSGCGKSSLLRCIAGLWPADCGNVTRHFARSLDSPRGFWALFLPQQPYLPNSTLRSVLTFPVSADSSRV